MKPTKSSVVKGSIAPVIGEVSNSEIVKNFNNNMRGSMGPEQQKTIPLVHGRPSNMSFISVTEESLNNTSTISAPVSNRASRNVALPPHPNTQNVTKSKGTVKVNMSNLIVEDKVSAFEQQNPRLNASNMSQMDSIDLAILSQV